MHWIGGVALFLAAEYLVFPVVVPVIAFALVTGFVNHWRRCKRKISTTKEAAADALKHLQEWAKWTSAVQAAILAIFGLLIKDGVDILAAPAATSFLIFTGTAMLCGAWLLSGIPSIRLRVGSKTEQEPSPAYNIYEYPLYSTSGWPPVSYILALHHWFWGAGLLSLGWLALERVSNGCP